MYDPILNLDSFLREVKQVTAIPGTSTSKRFDSTLTAWQELVRLRDSDTAPIVSKIGEAVIAGNSDALASLVSEWRVLQSGKLQELTFNMAEKVRATLRKFYVEDSARKNHELIAAAFNKTADKLTKHANTVNLNSSSDLLLTATGEVRDAWIEAPLLAAELTQRAPVLLTAIRLAGQSLAVAGLSPDDEALAATVDATGLHRRRVFEAWNNTEHRAQKWGALIKLGATVHARPLDKLETYRAPQPTRTEYVPNKIGHQIIEVDPEDELTPQPA